MRPVISIVVINWNAGEQLLDCVRSILKNDEGNVSEIIVIDNDSSDGSELKVQNLEKVSLLRAESNLGFAKACNLGAGKTQSEYLLFLNPDTKLYPDTLEHALSFMQSSENQQIGICGVQLLDENDQITRTCTHFPNFYSAAAHSLGISRVFRNTGYFMSGWDHKTTRIVDHVIGAFFLVRRDLFIELGGFDERFFVYLEDLDFSYRARQAGWKSVYLTDVKIFHAGGGTSRQVKHKRLFYSLRSRILYAFKHFHKWQAWSLLFLTCLIEPQVRILSCIVKRDWQGVKNTFQGYRMLYRAMPCIVTQRNRKF